MRNEIIEIAKTEVGYKEYSNNHTKYGEWFGTQDEWCAIFISWLANEVGILNTLIPKQAYVPSMVQWYKNKRLFRTRGVFPQKGDIIFFDYNKNGIADHVGIVEKCESDIITVIEGNKSNQVIRCTYDVNNAGIYGFGLVQYPEENKESKLDGSIASVQAYLNTRYGFNLVIDNIFGIKTKTALVKALQTEFNNTYGSNLVIDGIFGVKTKGTCPNIRLGANGAIVYLIRGMLICKGYNLVLDGIFGNNTLNAIKDFQRKNSIVVDGVVGKNTFNKLFV